MSYLGIDVGTSGTKALLMDSDARVLATAMGDHEASHPQPLWSEQDPEGWWRATQEAVKAVIAKSGRSGREIKAIGFSGQMHGLVITDKAGKPLRPSIIWNDQRTAAEAAEIEQAVGGRSRLVELVGNPAMTSFTLTKLMWVKRHEPAVYERIAHMLLPKDYIRLKLTGEYAGDVSDMSGTLMLDQRRRDWSKQIVETFQLDRSILPPVVESHEVTGRVRADVAEQLGLAAGTVVVGGAGDQPAGAVGAGVVAEGLTSATVGTSGVVFVHSKAYQPDEQGRVNTFCAAVAGEYCMFGCMLAVGGSFQWFRDVLGQAEVAAAKAKGIDPYELLTAEAEKAPAGCEGLFWLPYLTGERTPHADPHARACWIGISPRTRRAELVRSVMEGATFAMNDAMTLLKACGRRIDEVRLAGGGARSTFWRQMQADIYGVPCAALAAEEGPALGAALLAAVGEGRFKNVAEACKVGVATKQRVQPDEQRKKLYARQYDLFRQLYPALKESFARISR